jgi:precorrin-2 dehydrogenase/sirohydrochlorin ferrochelatase
MKYYPIFLRVAQRSCLVVGGGVVAEQKVASLLDAAAAVTVISPRLTPRLAKWAAAQRVTHHRRRYAGGDLRGFVLVYAATGDHQVHAQIAQEAADAGVLLNVVDAPAASNFITPATLQRGDLILAASTSGTSPALAKRIRHDLQATFGDEYAVALQVLGRLRERLAGGTHSPEERRRIFTTLAESPLVDHLRQRDRAAVDRLLAQTVGHGMSLGALGVEWS